MLKSDAIKVGKFNRQYTKNCIFHLNKKYFNGFIIIIYYINRADKHTAGVRASDGKVPRVRVLLISTCSLLPDFKA